MPSAPLNPSGAPLAPSNRMTPATSGPISADDSASAVGIRCEEGRVSSPIVTDSDCSTASGPVPGPAPLPARAPSPRRRREGARRSPRSLIATRDRAWRAPTTAMVMSTVTVSAAITPHQLGVSPRAPALHHGTSAASHAPIGRAATVVAARPSRCRYRRPEGPRSTCEATTSNPSELATRKRVAGRVVICEARARRASSARVVIDCGSAVDAPPVSLFPPVSVAGAGFGSASAWPVIWDGASAPSASRAVGARSVSWIRPRWWVEGPMRREPRAPFDAAPASAPREPDGRMTAWGPP